MGETEQPDIILFIIMWSTLYHYESNMSPGT